MYKNETGLKKWRWCEHYDSSEETYCYRLKEITIESKRGEMLGEPIRFDYEKLSKSLFTATSLLMMAYENRANR